MKLPFNESNLTSAIAQVGLSLQQYDWLIEVVAWLWPEPVTCNFLLRNYRKIMSGGRGVVRAKGLRMVNTEMVSTIEDRGRYFVRYLIVIITEQTIK